MSAVHNCGAGIEAYELSRVEGGPFDGQAVMGCPACGWEWLAGWEAAVEAASEVDDEMVD